jgi:hypothetical protein
VDKFRSFCTDTLDVDDFFNLEISFPKKGKIRRAVTVFN